MNILIADTDSYTTARLFSAINQSCPGWHVSAVTSGFQCLEALKKRNCPDVLILGKDLYDVSGLELIELIRDDSDIPVIFLSDDKEIQTLLIAFYRGATDYIVKPFNENVFLARLKAVIRRKLWDLEIEVSRSEAKSRDISAGHISRINAGI
jgi:DNA-binding response OmpR family regulator